MIAKRLPMWALGMILASAIFGLGGKPAMAQMGGQMYINCDVLTGSPKICIVNRSNFPITDIQATTGNVFDPNAWIHIPGGAIPPNGMAIVNFPAFSKGCNLFVYVRTATGTKGTGQTDVCRRVTITIPAWS